MLVIVSIETVLFLAFIGSLTAAPWKSVDKIVFNPEGLSISSFLRRRGEPSRWVDSIFGNHSIFSAPGDPHPLSHRQNGATAEDIALRRKRVEAVFQLPSYEQSKCFVEMLGYVRLDIEEPFKEDRRARPIFGSASLRIKNDAYLSTWSCYYRPVYENWRQEPDFTRPNYWAVLFFCPAPIANGDECDRLDAAFASAAAGTAAGATGVPIKVVMPISETRQLSTMFVASFDVRSIQSTDTKQKDQLAVCLPIPYTSSDKEKRIANDAILAEWIRYYRALGMKLFIYDRDGANYDAIHRTTAYKTANSIDSPVDINTLDQNNLKTELLQSLDVLYYNYTIRGKLIPHEKGFEYDNTELTQMIAENEISRRTRHQSQGHDKVLTLTHCRFEAMAVFGIENVFVVDYDEFLFCPIGGKSTQQQQQFLQKYLFQHKTAGVEQLTFAQRQTLNLTESPRDCMIDHVRANTSIFDCFAPYEYYMGSHSSKAFHLSHVCPLTGYHQACPAFDIPFSHDCRCNAKAILSNPFRPYSSILDRECAIVHISSNINSYNPNRYKYSPEEINEIKKKTNTFKLAMQKNKKKK